MEEESHEYSKFERDSGTAWNFLHLDCALLKLARTSSVVVIAAMWAAPFLPFVSVIAHLPDFTMHMIILLILSVLELPFCCTFLNFCIALQKVTSLLLSQLSPSSLLLPLLCLLTALCPLPFLPFPSPPLVSHAPSAALVFRDLLAAGPALLAHGRQSPS
eukprot:756237-Hanusia_phi.AAC.7